MVLSPDARVLSGNAIDQNGTNNRDILAVFTCTNTVDIGPSELVFPDPAIKRVFPRFGAACYLLREGNEEWWSDVVDVTLSQQVLAIPFRRVNLVAVALIPENGCQMDVETLRN